MATAIAAEKERVLVALEPELSRLLRFEKAETRVPVCKIIENLIRDHYASKVRADSPNGYAASA